MYFFYNIYTKCFIYIWILWLDPPTLPVLKYKQCSSAVDVTSTHNKSGINTVPANMANYFIPLLLKGFLWIKIKWSFSLIVNAFRYLLWLSILIRVNLTADWNYLKQQWVPDKFHNYTLLYLTMCSVIDLQWSASLIGWISNWVGKVAISNWESRCLSSINKLIMDNWGNLPIL